MNEYIRNKELETFAPSRTVLVKDADTQCLCQPVRPWGSTKNVLILFFYDKEGARFLRHPFSKRTLASVFPSRFTGNLCVEALCTSSLPILNLSLFLTIFPSFQAVTPAF